MKEEKNLPDTTLEYVYDLSPFPAVFLVQFLLLSLFFGIPMMTFFISLGQYLGSGVIDVWRISPIFQVCVLCMQ